MAKVEERVIQPRRDEEEIIEVRRSNNTLIISQLTGLIWLAFGLLEAVIGLRIFLELIDANPGNTFAHFVYIISGAFVWPFYGLTVTPSVEGFTLDIPSIIAMIVYLFMTWALVNLIWILSPKTYGQRIIHRHFEEE